MMDLLFWRHAHALPAHEGQEDSERALSPKGERQARAMAEWLDRHLPEGTRILSSPALRTRQTVQSLARAHKLRAELALSAIPEQVLDLARWPSGKGTVLLVGHEPWIGQVLSQILQCPPTICTVRKGSVWWVRQRSGQTQLVTVQTPDRLMF